MVLKFSKFALIAATCGACFALSPAAAFEPTTEAEKALVGWLEEANCSMTQGDFMDKALSGSGIPGSDLMKARRAMTKSGVIKKGSGNSMTLTAGDACGDVKIAAPTYDSGSEKDVLVTKLIGVFEANNCVLTERRARTLFEAEGLTRAQLDIAGEALDDDGAFKDTDAGLQLTIGKCADFVAKKPEGDDKTRVMAMFEQNGCSLMDDQLPDVAQQFQVTRKQFRAVTKPMEEEGAFKEEGDKITLLVGDICGGETASASNEDTPEAASKLLIALAEDNECSLTEDLVEDFFAANEGKFSPSSLDDAFDLLEDNGSIIISDDRQSARLVKGATCEKVAQQSIAAYEPKTDDERTVIKLFEENGCTLTEDDLPALGKKYEITKKAFKTAGRSLMDAGLFAENGDDITLLGGKCADGGKGTASPGGDKRALVIRVFEENSCAMTKDVAREKLEAVGLDVDKDRDLVRGMIKEGLITLGDDRDTATLVTGDVCGEAKEAITEASVDDQIIALFEAGNCKATEDSFEAEVERLGLDEDALGERIGEMIESGDITFDGESDTAMLHIGDVCGKGKTASGGDKRSKIIALFEGNGCRMTEDQARTLFPTVGLDIENDSDVEVIEQLFEAGDIIEGKSDEAILVTGDVCADQQQGASAMQDAIEAAFVENDCSLTEDEFKKALADSDFDIDEAGEIVEAMIESGDATYDRGANRAKLLIGACAK